MKGSYPFSHMSKEQQIELARYETNTISELSLSKPPKKVRQILRNPKDQRPPLSSAKIHKIFCSCGQIYCTLEKLEE